MHRLVPLCLLLSAACGPRTASWPSAEPRTIRCEADPAAVFESALTTFRISGYQVLEYDPERLYIQVLSKVDGDVIASSSGVTGGVTGWSTRATRRASYVNFQFFPDGTLMISVAGYHVQGGRLDPRVGNEIDSMVGTIFRNAGLAPPPGTPASP
jgi:hypothetical protein